MDGSKRPRRDAPPAGAINPAQGKGKGKGKSEVPSAPGGTAQAGHKGKGKGKAKHDSGGGGGGGGANAGRKRPQFGRPPPRAGKDSTSAMPRTLQPLEHAEARACEIAAMVASLAARHGAKRVHQTLPRHMRRRAMSYNVKRLPVRLRAAALRETCETLSPAEKARGQSRRHRRRPSKLRALAFAVRAGKAGWLETHMWHAKRMHMISKWGLRLARTPCDKSVRAAHRAVNRACTIHDASHAGVIELAGTRDSVLQLLSQVVTPPLDPSETIGEVELSRLLCHPCQRADGSHSGSSADGGGNDARNSGALVCPVTLLWRQSDMENKSDAARHTGATSEARPDDTVLVWVYTPASAYTEALELLTDGAAETETTIGSVTVVGRRGELLRFELVGTEATAVLARALAPEPHGPEGLEQVELWEAIAALNAASTIRRRAVLALTVLDPRLTPNAQGRRRDEARDVGHDAATRASLQRRCVAAMARWPSGVARSAIWSSDVRRQVKEALVAIKTLNERRSAMGIPGAALPPTPSDARVPILLIQRPGAPPPATGRGRRAGGHGVSHGGGRRGGGGGGGGGGDGGRRGCQAGYGGGWDIIIPAGWGTAFWLPLVFAGARAIGLEERRLISFEKGVPHFPYDFPDTASGREEATEAGAEARRKHNRKPPKRRVNYATVGVTSPFRTGWASIAGVAHTDECVLPECKHEQVVRVCRLYSGLHELLDTMRAVVLARTDDKGEQSDAGMAVERPPRSGIPSGTLLCVHVTLAHRGAPSANAMICAPTDADMRDLLAHPRSAIHGPRYNGKDAVSSSRNVIGAITSGAFSLTRGRGFAIGFVSAAAVCRLPPRCLRDGVPLGDCPRHDGVEATVLVRDINSLQFRWARASVCSGAQHHD